MPSWRGAQLKQRDNFTFYLTSLHAIDYHYTERFLYFKISDHVWDRNLDLLNKR